MEYERVVEPQISTEMVTYKKYKRRWYILGTFSLLACLQCLVWNTYGPIDAPITYAYGWSNSTVAMMANWGTITFVLIVFPLCYLLEIRGLRVATITVSVLVALGAVLRVISTDNTIYTISAHICAILNGFAGATIMSAPPALSAIWFPPEERTTATCINQVFNNLGNGVAFIMGPYLVPDRNLTNATLVSDVKKEIRIYMGIDAGWGVALLLAFLIYFPKQPPSPPSASASMPRTDFKDGFKAIVKDRNVWLCTFAYAMSGGINGAWQAVMTLNFAPLGVDDEESGRIGLVMCFSCCVLGIAISFGTDHLRKHIKMTLIVLLILEALSFTWLTLICAKVIPFSVWQLYVSTVVGASLTFSLAPLFFEYTVELTYPAPEILVGGFLTCFNNLVAGAFLAIFFIHDIGTVWMNYVLVASALVSIPAVMFTKESYRRLDIDVPSTSSQDDLNAISSNNHPYSIIT